MKKILFLAFGLCSIAQAQVGPFGIGGFQPPPNPCNAMNNYCRPIELPKPIGLCGPNGQACQSAPVPVNPAVPAVPAQPAQATKYRCIDNQLYEQVRDSNGFYRWNPVYWQNGQPRSC